MSKIITVKAVPSTNYGKFQWTYRPLCELGKQALAAVKKSTGYKVTQGRQERNTFTQEWIDELKRYAPDLRIVIKEVEAIRVWVLIIKHVILGALLFVGTYFAYYYIF